MSQQPLFPGDEPERSIARVAEGNEEWIEEVLSLIRATPRDEHFTTDRLWWELDRRDVDPPRDGRAMGAAIRTARKAGLIIATGTYKRSVRPACHARPIPIWRRA